MSDYGPRIDVDLNDMGYGGFRIGANRLPNAQIGQAFTAICDGEFTAARATVFRLSGARVFFQIDWDTAEWIA